MVATVHQLSQSVISNLDKITRGSGFEIVTKIVPAPFSSALFKTDISCFHDGNALDVLRRSPLILSNAVFVQILLSENRIELKPFGIIEVEALKSGCSAKGFFTLGTSLSMYLLTLIISVNVGKCFLI